MATWESGRADKSDSGPAGGGGFGEGVGPSAGVRPCRIAGTDFSREQGHASTGRLRLARGPGSIVAMGHDIGVELTRGRRAGRDLLARLDRLDAVDRRWARRHGEAIVRGVAARLVRDLPADVDLDAVPAALAYALAVVIAAGEGSDDDARTG